MNGILGKDCLYNVHPFSSFYGISNSTYELRGLLRVLPLLFYRHN